VNPSVSWQQRVGNQRDWVWQGWQTRYTYIRPPQSYSTLAPPVLLLHGFGTSIGHWRHNLPVVGQHYPIYGLDLLGFGSSRKALTTYTIDLWVEQVYEFWRTLIQHPMVLVGNSIGSLVALSAAATYPEMVKGLVFINLPDFSLRDEAVPSWLRPVVSTVEGLVASPVLLQSLFYLLRRPSIVQKWAGLAYANPKVIDAELVDILTQPARDRGAAATFSALFKAMTSSKFGPQVKSVLPTLERPVLLIWGRQDRMIPPQLAQQFAALNPNVELIELDNAGHCPHDECPEQFNQILLNWLVGI